MSDGADPESAGSDPESDGAGPESAGSDPESDGAGPESAGSDPETLREMRRLVDDLAETTADLRALGEESGVPAVERTAKRIEGVMETLDQQLPPELVDEE